VQTVGNAMLQIAIGLWSSDSNETDHKSSRIAPPPWLQWIYAYKGCKRCAVAVRSAVIDRHLRGKHT
jgi:hypothetical protein